jgi:hypothetical protein
MVLPIAGGADIDFGLSVLGRVTTGDPAPTVSISMNGTDLGACALEAGWKLCAWHAPATVVRDGANEVVVRSSVGPAGDSRTIGVAVRQILLRRR